MTEAVAPETGVPARQLLVLCLGEARFGLWLDEVREIVRTPPISRLPLASPEVPGVASVRGDVVPVLDLGIRLLGVPAARPGRLVIVWHEQSGSRVALLVDSVDGLASVGEQELRPPPAAAEARLSADLMMGVVSGEESVITVLHLGRAAAPPAPSTEPR